MVTLAIESLVAAYCLALIPAGPVSDARQACPAERERVNAFLAEPRWPALRETVKAWSRLPQADRAALACLLVPALRDRHHVGVHEPGDLFNPFRAARGDLSTTHVLCGHAVWQDVFLVGGKAAWALSQITGEGDLPLLDAGLTEEEWDRRAAIIAGRVKKFLAPPDASGRESR